MTGLRFTSKDLDRIYDAANRYSVGLDDLFYRLNSYGHNNPGGQYPPYNIVKESNVRWRIEMALAGWDKEEFEVTTESNVLLVSSKAPRENKEEEYMHRGVANRTFARGFNLSDDVIVDGVNFNNGLLTIYLQKVVPDHQALKVYDIE